MFGWPTSKRAEAILTAAATGVVGKNEELRGNRSFVTLLDD
jgi:hypothetical protein